MIRSTAHRYVVCDPEILGGEPIIIGTRTPVRRNTGAVAGTAPEEIPSDLPGITLAQVFDALSYYSDHAAEINAHIEANRVPEESLGSPGE